MSDKHVAETSTSYHTTPTTKISMPPVGFEPTISAGERPQTYALDRAAHNFFCWVESLVRGKYGLPCYAVLYIF